MGIPVYIEKKLKILTHFCLKIPPFVVAQINNCNAQGKVTQKNSNKVKHDIVVLIQKKFNFFFQL
jgi:hypothetical protein